LFVAAGENGIIGIGADKIGVAQIAINELCVMNLAITQISAL
jgi:hypothetical protein